MKVIVTPHRIAFDNYCRENKLNPRQQVWVNKKDDIYKTYGLELKESDIELLHEWYLIDDAQRVFERVRK